MKGTSTRRRILLWVSAAFVFSALLLVVAPMIQKALVRGRLTGTLNNARQLQIAMQMMALDSANNGQSKGGYPADLGVKSKAEFLARLTRENYLSTADAEKLSENLSFVNASRFDPPDTALIVLKESSEGSGFVLMTTGGSGGIYRRPTDVGNPNVIRLPNRQPQILPDR